MIEHLQHGPVHGDMCVRRAGRQAGRGDTQHNEAHMIHGRVRDQPLEVCLGVRGESTEDDGRDGKEGKPAAEGSRLNGIERKDKPQEAVGAQLQKDPGQDHRSCGRGFSMCVRQPGMKRPDRHLDRECDDERPKSDRLDRVHGQPQQDGARIQRIPACGEIHEIVGPEENAQHLNPQQ